MTEEEKLARYIDWLEDELAEKVVTLEAEIKRLNKMVDHATACGVTFPPDTLPKVAAPVVVVDPRDLHKSAKN